MIVIAVLAILTALAIPGILKSSRTANEQNAASSLKTVATAEADFKTNDADNNAVRDFWTGDIAGLYAIDNTSTGTALPSAIKLIEGSVALADLWAATGSLSNGNYANDISTFGIRSNKAGYWYGMLLEDLSTGAAPGAPAGLYQQDTDGSGDAVHNSSRFGAVALPEAYGSTGHLAYIVNERNTMFSRDFGGELLNAGVIPPTSTGLFDRNWPDDATRAAFWSKLD